MADVFHVSLYNGSNWTVTGVTIRLVVKEKDGTVRWDRLSTADRILLGAACRYFRVVFRSACPMSSMMLLTSTPFAASVVPKVWRKS